VEGPPDQGPAGVALSEQLARYLKVLRRRWLVIVAVPLIAGGVSLAIGLSQQKKYDATARLVVDPTNPVTAVLNPGANSQSNDPERDLNTEVSLITTVPLADSVIRQLRLHTNHDDLLAQVQTALDGTTNIVDVTVRDPDPAQAARIANAFASQYIATRAAQARSAFDQAAAQARAQLASLTSAQRKGPAGLQLRSRLQELVVDSTLQTGNAHVIQPASPPTSAATPRLKLDLALGLFLGLILGVVAAGVLELLDRRVKDEDDVTALAPFPVLATIPEPRRASEPRPLRLDRERTEGYRSLATNLRFFKLGDQVRTLMISSAGPRSGKTSATLSLAVALAEFGQNVIAVECDLRRPRFAEYLDLPQSPGLSSALAGLTSWVDEVVFVPLPDGAPGRVSVLPGGPPPPNPQALLSSPDMAEILGELRASESVILIDTPPLAPLTDAVTLLPSVDGVALVVRLGRTTRDELRRTCQLLDEFHAAVLGTILTGGQASLGGFYYGDTPAQGSKTSDPSRSRTRDTVARSA
jgi:polysaccharide biosynthesis transport protein